MKGDKLWCLNTGGDVQVLSQQSLSLICLFMLLLQGCLKNCINWKLSQTHKIGSWLHIIGPRKIFFVYFKVSWDLLQASHRVLKKMAIQKTDSTCKKPSFIVVEVQFKLKSTIFWTWKFISSKVGVSWAFHGCFKGIFRLFQSWFKSK